MLLVNLISTILQTIYQLQYFPSGIFRVIYIYYHIICKWHYFDFGLSNYHFDFFGYLNAIVKTSSVILSSYGERGQVCLVPDFNIITFCFSPFNLMLASSFLSINFIVFRYVFCIHNFTTKSYCKCTSLDAVLHILLKKTIPLISKECKSISGKGAMESESTKCHQM